MGPEARLRLSVPISLPKWGEPVLGSALLSSDGRYLYVTDYSFASVTTLAVDDVKGALKYVSTASYGIVNEDRPVGLATSKNGEFVFCWGT